MNSFSVLPIKTLPSAGVDSAVPASADAATGADFAEILAVAPPGGRTTAAVPPATIPILPAEPQTAGITADAANAGKDLPPALPSAPDPAGTAASPTISRQRYPVAAKIASIDPAPTSKDQYALQNVAEPQATDDLPAPTADPVPVSLSVTLTAPPSDPLPSPSFSAAKDNAVGSAPRLEPVPLFIQPQLPSVRGLPISDQTAAPQAALQPQAAPPAAAPSIALTLKVEPAPQSAPVVATAVVLNVSRAAMPAADQEDAAIAIPITPSTGPSHAAAQPPASAVTTPAPAISSPHDFAALIDRIAAAREAALPQIVTMAMSHADFGPVRMQFRHEDGGLNVTLANADPDFARVVAAAPPPAPSAPASDGGNLSGQRREAETAGFSQGRSQSPPDRRDERPGRSSTADPHRSPAKPAEKSGIFA
ncbi:MAG: hypothetical protein JSR96_04765 [Proteobacteria bacterium]|nr:hypothetical protein [Pseudomonadota bacterium]